MKKILIIDDEIAILTVFETVLKEAGYEVKTAMDGKSGIQMAQSELFDLILCDQMMPDMSGNEVLKTLKADEATKNVKIAIITNFGQDDMIKDAMQSGAIDYILKYQISPEDLAAKVKSLIGE